MKVYNLCLKALVFFLFIFLGGLNCPCAASQNFTELLSFLENRFPPIYKPFGTITEIHGDRVVFKPDKQQERPGRGTEFLVTTYSPEIPIYLQPLSSVIKVISFFNGNILCTHVVTVGQPLKTGDMVVIPPSPTVYLYTNITEKNAFSPYNELLNKIIDKNLEVVEVPGVEIKQKPSRFGVLVCLEAGNGYLTYKVKSLYSQDTLYTNTADFDKHVAVSRPVGSRVRLAYMETLPETSPEKIAAVPTPPTDTKPFTVSALPPSISPPVTEKAADETPFKAKKTDETLSRNKFSLSEAYHRFVWADMNGDHTPSLFFLNNQGIFEFQQDQNRLRQADQYLFHSPDIIGVHLHKGDMNGDGKDELLVTLAETTVFMGREDSRLCSMVLTRKNGSLTVVQDRLDYYLRVIQNREGETEFIGQTKVAYDQYDGFIFKILYEKNSIRSGPEYRPARNIYSIYQFNFDIHDSDQIMIIEPSNYVYGYFAPLERVEAMSSRQYGKYKEISYPQKLKKESYTKGFSDKVNFEMVYTPRRFELKKEFDGQCFLINKERQAGLTAENVLNKVLSRDEALDTIVGISWRGDSIVETWESKGLAKDIIDYCFYDNKVYVLTRDSLGDYALEVLR